MLAVDLQVALMSSSQSEMWLLQHFQEEFAMSLDLLFSSILNLLLLTFSANNKGFLKIKTFVCHLSIIRRFVHSVCVHIYISFFNHKQLNGISQGVCFVKLPVHGQVALMSSSQRQTRLLQYVQEQFGMSLHFLCSTISNLRLLLFSANNNAVERDRSLCVIFQ